MTSVASIASAVREGRQSARGLAEAFFRKADSPEHDYCAITRLLRERALAEADAVDSKVAAGIDPGPLAGVPFAVKDLFDVAGLPTTAGSTVCRDAAPASADAEAVRRLTAAGAVLVATLNMDEFAYGFATINPHYGTTRNPHDRDRLAGGSSGGSAAVVAAGLLPFSLGSDTNGSVRVPAALTGLYGLKPTHGALPMDGVFPFADSMDDVGHFTRSAADLRLVWEVLSGQGGQAPCPRRIARLDGWYRRNADPQILDGIDAMAGDGPLLEVQETARARSAAFLVTAAEGGALHLPRLRTDPMLFGDGVRERLMAGALVPASTYLRAKAFQRRFRAAMLRLFERADVLVAPAAPCVAPLIADPVVVVDGERTAARADLGLYTQPISFAGLPVVSAPLKRPGQLPLGIQLIGPPGGEAALFAYAEKLEDDGWIGFSSPEGGNGL